LRDYGVDGQIGLEVTPDEYIANLVAVFRECKRILRDDGTMFVNVGDSYFSGGQRAAAYDIFDKELASFPDDDLILKSLCGECRRDYQSHISRNDSPLVAMLATSTLSSIHAHKEFESDHFPTLDSCRQASQIEVASQDDFALDQSFFAEQLRAFLVSKIGVSSQQLLDEWMQRGNSFLCLSCGRSLVGCDLESAHKLHRDLQEQSPHIRDSALHGDQQAHHNQCRDKDGEYCKEIVSYQNYTTKYLKPKDLIGIPWMLAFALRADGWYLRQDIIWAKPNPMPESVKDRCTKSHEYIFLLSKNKKYYYDNEAVKETAAGGRERFGGAKYGDKGLDKSRNDTSRFDQTIVSNRNKRDVWTVTSKPYKGAHYATFPPDLIKPCILAGAPETCCAKCGAPYERVVERDRKARNELPKDDPRYRPNTYHGSYENINGKGDAGYTFTQTLGFEPTCDCNAGTSSGIVFDPFVGSGTTVATAIQLGRKGIGIDLSFKYLQENAKARVESAELPLLDFIEQ